MYDSVRKKSGNLFRDVHTGGSKCPNLHFAYVSIPCMYINFSPKHNRTTLHKKNNQLQVKQEFPRSELYMYDNMFIKRVATV